MKSDPSDDHLLGCLFLAFFCALDFLAGALAWNTLLARSSGFSH